MSPNSSQSRTPVIVIGAGVIGLSTALALQRAGYQVKVIADHIPAPSELILPTPTTPSPVIDYTSYWAGAHNRWVPPVDATTERDHGFAVATMRHMKAEAARVGADTIGVTFCKGEDHLEVWQEEYRVWLDGGAEKLGMEGFKVLDEDERPEGVTWGCSYDTWCVNPMVYLAHLVRTLSLNGCSFECKKIDAISDVFDPTVKTVINCSGRGFGDHTMQLIRGQTTIVSNPCPKTITRQCRDGTWSFCIPRNFNGGTIIGGTKELDSMQDTVSIATRDTLLATFTEKNAAFVINEMQGPLTWLADVVGRRPARTGGPRVEREELPEATVIHAYGLGGRGYELSWGIAEAVVNLVKTDSS